MRRVSIILLASLFMLGSSYAASSYKWVDSNGHVVYSQQPPAEGTRYQRIKTIAPSSRPSSTSDASSPAGSARESIMQDEIKRKKNELVKKEMEKNAAKRADDCKLAKDHLRFYQVQRRWKDKDGNIKSMDDKERLKKLDEAKQQVADFCS
ncbi:hypothetical protein MNBD_GAMMA24-813 [hydrothermal vent metagenome]|uniref:DUF4124 domain-containing protein n=1 Tax=hydrothermal vent metagenome TaxID=652676 RepID=A0A3B1BM63_9ZZZZ